MIAYLSVIVAIAGALIYALAKDKAAEIGRLMFGCGLLAFLLAFSLRMVSLWPSTK